MTDRTRLLFLAPLAALAACGGGGGEGGPPKGGGFSVQVVVEPAERRKVTETLSVVGSLAANEAVDIRTEVGGQVETVSYEEGARVGKGAVLFRIEEEKLAARLAEAEPVFRQSKANFERAKGLLGSGTISPQEFEVAQYKFEADRARVRLLQKELEEATIRAPFEGRLGARLVSPGQVVEKGTMLGTIVDADPIKLEAKVSERYADRLRPGMPVDLAVATLAGETFRGKVYFVSPQIDPATRTVLVKAEVTNRRERLRPGMFANLSLAVGKPREAVVIPEEAVVRRGDVDNVFVAGEGDKAEMRRVTLGARFGGSVEVTDGVAEGERVVTRGVQKIGPGVPLSFGAAPAVPVSTGTPATKT